MYYRSSLAALVVPIRAIAAAIALLLGLAPRLASAQSVYWVGNSDNPYGFWGFSDSWSSSPTTTNPVPVPTTGSAVVLTQPPVTSPPTYYNLGNTQFQSIVINNTGAPTPYSIVPAIAGTDVIGLQSGGFIETASAQVTLNTGLTLNGPATISVLTTDGGISFAAVPGLGPTQAQAITGTGGLTLVNNGNSGALQISSVNTYTGGTTVNGTSSVLFNVNGAVPTNGALVVNGIASFATSSTIGSMTGPGTVLVQGGNALTVGTDNTNTTFSGSLQDWGSGSASLVKVGSGTLTLSGTNTYSGGTVINGGTLAVSADTNLGAATGGLTFDGGTLYATGASSIFTTSRPITINSGGATFENDSGALTFLNGNISGTGGLTMSGSGYLVLEGTNTYAGPTQINSGVLFATASGTLPSTSDVTVGAQGTLIVPTVTIGSLSGSGTVYGNGTLSVGADNASTSFSGSLQDYPSPGFQLGLTKIGNGTLTLSGNNSYSGGTTISSGTLQIGDGGTSGAITGNVVNSGTLSFDHGDSITFGGTISGAGSVQQIGSGTLTLSGTNTYSGGTVIGNGGTLSVSSDANLGAATGGLTFNGGTLYTTGASSTFQTNRPITLNAGGATFVNDGGAYTDLSGTISGTGGLTMNGSGLLLLGTANTYSGPTQVNSGELEATGPNALPSTSAVTVGAGGLLITANQTIGSLAGSGSVYGIDTLAVGADNTSTSFSGSLLDVFVTVPMTLTKIGNGTLTLSGNNSYSGGTTISSGTLQIGAGGTSGAITGNVVNNGTLSFDRPDSVTFAGTISGTGSVQQIGSGTLTLSGTNTYSGGTVINGGTVAASADSNLGAATGGLALEGGTLQFAGSFTSSRPVLLSGGGGTFDTNGNNVTLSGTIQGTGGLSKINAGTLMLTGANSYAGGTTIDAGTLQLGNGGTSGSILGDVTNNGTLSFNLSDVVTFGGVISGSGAVQQQGSGTVVLSGANTYSGGTLINGGTVTIASDSNLGNPAGGLTFNNGGTLQIIGTSSLTSSRPITLEGPGGGTVDNGNGSTISLNGNITGTGQLTKVNQGVLILGGSNSYSGTTDVLGGGLAAGSANAFSPNSDYVLYSLSSLTLGSYNETIGSLAGLGVVTGNGVTLTAGGDNASTVFSGTMADSPGPFSLDKVGTGTMTLTGANVYTGGTTIEAGALQIGNGGNIGSIEGDVVDNALLSFDRSDGVTFAGTISGSGALQQLGSGTLILTGANTYTGGTTISAGTLQLGNGGTTGSIAGDVVDAGVFAFNRADNVAFGGVISGTGSLQQLGTGTLTLTGSSTYTGGTTIGSGTLQLGDGGTSGAIVGNVADNGTLGFDRADAVSFTGAISGTGAVQQLGSGITALNGTNTYSGATAVSAGTLQAGSAAGFSPSSAFTISSGALLDLNGYSETVGSLSGAGIVTSTGTTTTGVTLTAGGDNSSTVFGGTINDGASAVGLIKAGTGTLTLTGANAYSGGTVINAGTLQVGAGGTTGGLAGNITDNALLGFNRSDEATFGGVISGSGGLQQIGGGTLTLTGSNTYTGGTAVNAGTLQLGNGGTSGSIVGDVLNNGTLSFDRSDGTTFSGSISGSGNLIQIGAGTSILSGTNTYTGATDVQAGTLVVNGPLASPSVQVENAATLGGTGTINGAVTIASGGSLSPGSSNGPGTLTLASLALNPGAKVNYVLGAANVQGGSTNDLINVTGPLTLAGTLNVTSSGSLSLGLYRLFNYGGSLLDNGLAVGTLPGTYSGVIQESIPEQVNLVVDGPGALVQFWDGTTTNGDGMIHGGSGTWSAADTNTNWTAPNGAINASWQSGFGIFAGAAQTVTVAGPLTYQGLQFSSNGYQVSGSGTLVPVGLAPIRVDAGVTANIAVSITGTGGLLKSDPGTLVLSADNTYSGGTTITGGTLQLGNGGTSGSITGDVTNSGTLVFDRSDTMSFGGNISGTGGVQQQGSSITLLTGTNTYSGGTWVNGGTLQLGNGGTSGSIVGDVTNDGLLAFDRSDTVSLGGVISGTGEVQQKGSGTLVLTGNNTYSGLTTISAGTLQLGNGGTSGVITGDIANSGTLAFDRSDTVTFGGVISGSGGLEQLGSGETILTAANPYTGPTTVNAGTLIVNGSLASNVAVNAGATLGGSGSLGSLIVNSGGTLSPGGSFANLTVHGTLTFQPGSSYLVQVNPTGQSNRTLVNGSVTLAGGTVDVLAATGTYNTRTTYTILSTFGGVNGTFAGVTSNLAFLTPTLTYDADDVFLQLARNNVSFESVGTNGNQAAVGTAVQLASQEGTPSSNGTQLLNAIESLSAATARTAFASLSGEGVTAVENVALLSNDLFLSSMHDEGQISMRDSRTWGTFFGSIPHYKGDASLGTAAQNDTVWGAAVGSDARVGSNLLLGAALGGSDGDLSVPQRQTGGEVHGLHLGGYGTLNLKPFYISTELAYSRYTNETTRTIAPFGGLTAETEQADFASQAFRSRIEVGRWISLAATGSPTLSVTPYVALEPAWLRNSAFTESDPETHGPGLLGLAFVSHTTPSAPALLGVKFDDLAMVGRGWLLEPELNLAWEHEFAPRRDLTASLISLPTTDFTVVGAQPSHDALQVRAGTQLRLSPAASLYLDLQGDLSTHLNTYTGQGGVRLNW